MRNLYALLGVHRGSSQQEVKTAWRLKARELHPDRYPSAAPLELKEVSARFADVSLAYNTLSDDRGRAAYDERLILLGKKCRSCGGQGFRARAKGGFANVTTAVCTECDGCGFVDVLEV